MSGDQSIIPAERIERAIMLVRGENVLLDSELAELYGVETRVLVQAVKRNRERFPADFMFQLSKQEFAILRSHSVTSRFRGANTRKGAIPMSIRDVPCKTCRTPVRGWHKDEERGDSIVGVVVYKCPKCGNEWKEELWQRPNLDGFRKEFNQ